MGNSINGWYIVLCIDVININIIYSSTNLLIDVADDLKSDGILFHELARITMGGYWPLLI